MDRVFIEELTVFAQIGVYDWEQQIKQKLVFDLEMQARNVGVLVIRGCLK